MPVRDPAQHQVCMFLWRANELNDMRTVFTPPVGRIAYPCSPRLASSGELLPPLHPRLVAAAEREAAVPLRIV